MSTQDDVARVLKQLCPDEKIDGASVEETAKMVDLEIAYKLLLVEHAVPLNEDALFHHIPNVVLGRKRKDGRYEIRIQTESGPDFRIYSEEQTKIMRARFLLLKNFYFKNLDMFSYSEQQYVGAKYDFGFVPDILRQKVKAEKP